MHRLRWRGVDRLARTCHLSTTTLLYCCITSRLTYVTPLLPSHGSSPASGLECTMPRSSWNASGWSTTTAASGRPVWLPDREDRIAQGAMAGSEEVYCGSGAGWGATEGSHAMTLAVVADPAQGDSNFVRRPGSKCLHACLQVVAEHWCAWRPRRAGSRLLRPD